MAGWPPKKNAAFTLTFPIYDADGDLVSGATGLDSEVDIDGAGFNDCTNEATEIGTSGIYRLALTAGEMNGDVITVQTKTTTSGAKTAVNVIYTSTRQIDDLAFPATSGRSIQVETDGMVHGDLKEWLGVAPLALTSQLVQGQANQLGAQAKADVNAEVDNAWTTQMADSVPADGAIPTREQSQYMTNQFLFERAVSGTTVTIYKVDGVTALLTLTINDATNPSSITRAT